MFIIRLLAVAIVAGIVVYVLIKHPDAPETIDMTKSSISNYDEFGYDENGFGMDGRNGQGEDIYGNYE